MQKQQIPAHLKAFSQKQLDIILKEKAVKQVVAAAGSGKTRTIIGLVEHRLLTSLEKAGKILLLSFSRKAVAELYERVPEALRKAVEISTFHAFCLRNLPSLYPYALQDMQVFTDEAKEKFFYRFFTQSHILEQVGAIPISLLWEEEDMFCRSFPKLHAEFLSAYQSYKKQKKLFEFEDLITLMLRSLKKPKASVRELRKRYDLIIIDEFQDTDPRQLEFLSLMEAPRKIVVGDDWQAIYAFRGACLQSFLQFQKSFSAHVMSLSENYRSLENIVHLGSRIIRLSTKQLPKKVRAVRGAGPGLPVLTLNLSRYAPAKLALCLQEQEAQSYRVLVRTNWQKKHWENIALAEHKEQIMTIHKAKGLEFPVVFLDLCGGWSRRHAKAHTARSLGALWRKKQRRKLEWDEEIRILYVGASRAMNLLVVLHLAPEESGEKEGYYYQKLISRYGTSCSIEELSSWLSKEADFRSAA